MGGCKHSDICLESEQTAVEDEHSDINALQSTLQIPRGIKYLEACFDDGSESLQKNLAGFPALSGLVRWISYGVSASTVDKILSFNSDLVDRDVHPGEWKVRTPLGVALRRQSTDVVDVLIKHGACIDGATGSVADRPIFETIAAMIKRQDLSILAKFVERGAKIRVWGDLNQMDLPPKKREESRMSSMRETPVTPIMYYLYYWGGWKQQPNPANVVKYMIDHEAAGKWCECPELRIRRIIQDMEGDPTAETLVELPRLLLTQEYATLIYPDCPYDQPKLWDQDLWISTHRKGDPICNPNDDRHRKCHYVSGRWMPN